MNLRTFSFPGGVSRDIATVLGDKPKHQNGTRDLVGPQYAPAYQAWANDQ
jgi:hypothetical protein